MVDLTLVIPTYNRHDHLSRLLSYYSKRRVTFSILILDSSETAIQLANQELVRNLECSVIHLSFSATIPVAKKLSEGLLHVNTPYCAFCADDDLVFVDGLDLALTYLASHSEFVCVDGIYLSFNQVGHDIQVGIEYGSKGIDPDHPCARAFRLFQRYESLFYGVFRTLDLQRIFVGVSELASLHYQELFQAVAALLIGKSHRLPIFYAGRQQCDPAEPARDKWQTYYWFADDRSEFLQHYVVYRDKLLAFYKQYGQKPQLTDQDFIKSMDLAHATFFGVNCPPLFFFNQLQHLWPTDAYKEIKASSDDISIDLKGNSLILWENRIDKFSELLTFIAEWCYSKSSIKSLNMEVRKVSSVAWNCKLPNNLKWLSSNKYFRKSFIDLCVYFNHNQTL